MEVLRILAPGKQREPPAGGPIFGSMLVDRFTARQQKEGTQDTRKRERAGGENGSLIAVMGEVSGNGRSYQKPEAERDADNGKRFGAILRACYIADIGLSRGQIAGRGAIDGARQEEHPDACGIGEHEEAGQGSRLTDQQHGPSSEAIGKLSENGPGNELKNCENGYDFAD